MLLWYLSFVFRMYEREQFRLAKKSKRIELDQVYANQASLTKFESEINKRLRLVGKKMYISKFTGQFILGENEPQVNYSRFLYSHEKDAKLQQKDTVKPL